MVPTYALDETEEQSRILTDAIYKFTDTSMGGNMVMNWLRNLQDLPILRYWVDMPLMLVV